MRTVILFIIYILLTLFLIPVLLFCCLMRYSQPLIAIGKWAMRIGQKILGIRLDVSGIERIDKKKSYLFMANHMSFLDGPLLFMLIPHSIRVILKKEIFRIPVIGQGMRQVGFIPVDRKHMKGGKASIDRASRMIKEKGYSFLIFPEGTRSRDGQMQPYKRGGFFLAVDSQVPIVPITIKGSFELMPKGRFFVKKGKMRVVFHRAVSTRGYNRNNLMELVKEIRRIIQFGLEEPSEMSPFKEVK